MNFIEMLKESQIDFYEESNMFYIVYIDKTVSFYFLVIGDVFSDEGKNSIDFNTYKEAENYKNNLLKEE